MTENLTLNYRKSKNKLKTDGQTLIKCCIHEAITAKHY
jgi:hypothetical protein